MPKLNCSQLAKVIRWAGRIIASVISLLFVTWGTYFVFFGSNTSGIRVAASAYTVVLLIVLAGLIISWWKDAIAGLSLIIFSIGIGITFNYYPENSPFWFLLSPYLAVGILAIWWLISGKSLISVVRLAARIMTTLAIGLAVVFFVANAQRHGPVLTWAIVPVLLAGLVLAWWKDMTAAALFLLLISAGIALFIYHFSYSIFGWLIFVLTFVIAIALLVTAGLLSEKRHN